MGKYIIDTDEWANLFEVRKVGVYGIGNDLLTNEKTVWSRMFRLDELEELNSDYINEHYGELQDEAYQKGFEDGKNNVENGCEGCKYESRSECEQPCCKCKRGCMDFYDPMSKDDRIEVGDEVDWDGDCFVVTRIYQPLIDKRCNGIAKDGSVYMDVVYDRLTKTGRHFDIASILEAMKS